MHRARPLDRWLLIAATVIVLLAAAGLRAYHLPERPFGLHYDEAANGILAGEIAQGLKRPIFIPSYTGKEVLFFYWTALWMKVLGISPLALRFSAAVVGVATVGATIWTVYELLRDYSDAAWIALTTGAFLAVSFWHLILSRYGFRAITQPLLQALTVAALWRGLRSNDRRWQAPARIGWFVLAGLLCGLTAYTYLAARAFPLPLAAGLVALVVVDRSRRRERLAQSGIVAGVASLVLIPLGYYWLTHPGSFTTRSQQVVADSWAEVWSGLWACLKMFFVRGDPYIRFNVPGRPVFGPIAAGLFLAGVGVGVRQLLRLLNGSGDPGQPPSVASHVFLLVSLPVMLLPSALAAGEITPSNLRTVGLLPFIYVFPALGVWAILNVLRKSLAGEVPLTRFSFPIACLLVLSISGAAAGSTYSAWSSSPALFYAADGDLATIAEYLNRADVSSTTSYVASRHYRHPTLAFLADDYEAVRWLVDGRSLVFPPEGDALLLFPRSAAGDLEWVRSMLPEDSLAEIPKGPDGLPAFHAFRAEIAEAPKPARRQTVSLGQSTRLMGYTVTSQPRSGGDLDIAIWLSVVGQTDHPDYRVVARLADQWGSIWGERLALQYPSEQWAEGELLVDHLSIPITPGAPPGEYTVRLGLYSPAADARLPILDDRGAYAGLFAELPVDVAPASEMAQVEDLEIDHRLDRGIDGLTLLGIDLDTRVARPGEPLRTTLFWRAEETAPPAYQLSLELGESTLYHGAAVKGTYPFDRWTAGEIIADRYQPRLPLDTPPGTHELALRVGDEAMVNLAHITVEATDRTFEVPSISYPLAVTLGHRVELLGYDLSAAAVAPGQTLGLTLTLRALTEMSQDYTVFTHLLAPDGSMAGQHDQQPVGGSYPTSLWVRREVVTDVYNIPVSPTATPGPHRLEVGMYVVETGARLPVEGTADNAVTLQTISVTE